jgi:hypothetical protein
MAATISSVFPMTGPSRVFSRTTRAWITQCPGHAPMRSVDEPIFVMWPEAAATWK